MKRTAFLVTVTLLSTAVSRGAEPNVLRLENEHLRATFESAAETWRLTGLARPDGSDALDLTSDEFEILGFDDSRFTANDYRTVGAPRHENVSGTQTLSFAYAPKSSAATKAPESVTITYSLGSDPWLHKTVFLRFDDSDRIDRLQVQRFSCARPAERGGEGQPVFVGNWFFGVDYPGFYSRHSDGFVEPDFNYRWHYTIDVDGRDRELAPRDGLVTLFHFPGDAKQQPDGTWGIRSKRAVMGIGRAPGEDAELGLLDYIAETRKPPRSHLHFNNWYSSEAKFITRENFVEKTARPIFDALARHGAHLDAMVPDHGWQDGKAFQSIYQPQHNATHEPLPEIRQALEQMGTKLGIWIALDGTNNSVARGKQVGYRSAYREGFDRSRRWMQGKDYFDILDPKYQADLKKALRYLMVEAEVDYIKHDFNHNFTSHDLTERHAREACLDVTLDLLAYERSFNEDVFQNYTNGSWFSPWWLQHVDTLWMMSGDSGNNTGWPQVSLRDNATTYRDSWIYQSFNNPDQCPRPILPVANLMTHGILFSKKKPYTDFKDPLHEWSDYVVMHLARGTMVKELYITSEWLDEEHWEVLGRAAAWACENQPRLMNTIYVGGDPAVGEVYGYVSWVDGRAILSARNPDRREQILEVPFDRSVYFRGLPGESYRARSIYPFVEPMPWKLVSGRSMSVPVPGDSVMIVEIEPGQATTTTAATPLPLPAAEAEADEASFAIRLPLPDEEMMRCDLLVQVWGAAASQVTLDGMEVEPRFQDGGRWTLSAYDLREHRGRTLDVAGRLAPLPNVAPGKTASVPIEIWLVADRVVDAPARPSGETLPLPISQQHRRVTQPLIPRSMLTVVP